MEILENEKQILAEIYSNPLELERLQTGNLYEYQLKALNKMRNFIAYLENKYQRSGFQLVRYEMATIDTTKDFFSFTYQDCPTHYHALFELDQQYRDDFYGYQLGEIYDQRIAALLSRFPVRGVKTFFKTLYHETIVFEEGIMNEKKPIRDTEIFIETNQDFSQEVYNILLNHGIKGNYRVYSSLLFSESLELDDYWKLWKERNEEIHAASFHLG